ncbi:MAG TPA: DUF86 domain-containing protein [Rhodoferax sp.]|jgi:uncharacterized protein with HEPN domain|nr:DUF86 domain-containing protein [Rhodoferax sp.]
MSKEDILRAQDYLAHIVEAIDRIHRYVDDMVELSFLSDEKTQDAVVRNFEILGEASNNIEKHHPAFAQAHVDVPWALMYTMRNRVEHGYFKVDYELVWKTIYADLPELRAQVAALIDSQKN